MKVIEIESLTKDYGKNRGVFDVSFDIKQGEIFGFLGPNGAGKTTTIRHLMGFVHQDQGSCHILGYDCARESSKIQEKLGYLPGEIAFMNEMTGMQFIRFIAKMKKCKDLTYAIELMRRFELNPSGKIRKMSKGMKQKIGIVCAFMNDPEVLILDEPTSGLDPLMQTRFVDLLLEEKAKGKTILMSSHIFEEIEKTCDRFAMIKEGKIVTLEDNRKIREERKKRYIIEFETNQQANDFSQEWKECTVEENKVRFAHKGDLKELFSLLQKYQVADMDISVETLEEKFIHLYGGKIHD